MGRKRKIGMSEEIKTNDAEASKQETKTSFEGDSESTEASVAPLSIDKRLKAASKFLEKRFEGIETVKNEVTGNVIHEIHGQSNGMTTLGTVYEKEGDIYVQIANTDADLKDCGNTLYAILPDTEGEYFADTIHQDHPLYEKSQNLNS